jgi:molybdopterin molybdotransferase
VTENDPILTRLPSLEEIASCVGGYDPNALPVAQAQDFIARFVPRLDAEAVEHVPLRSALGRVLARDIVSPIDVPAHDNSAMDGYALRGADLRPTRRPCCAWPAPASRASPSRRRPARRVRAHHDRRGDAGRPRHRRAAGVRQGRGGAVAIPAGRRAARRQPPPGRRGPGRGEAALPAGACCAGRHRPAGLARPGRGAGAARLRVAFFSTGDDCARSASRSTRAASTTATATRSARCSRGLGVELLDLGVVRDDPRAGGRVPRARRARDAVITSGGVSVGEADHTKQVMARLGDVLFWRIAMRPGGRWRSAASHRGRAASCSACPAIRWR